MDWYSTVGGGILGISVACWTLSMIDHFTCEGDNLLGFPCHSKEVKLFKTSCKEWEDSNEEEEEEEEE
jgi:hypothetical protein